MNKIKTLIILILLQSCYIEDILEQDVYLIPETMCDCVYYDDEIGRWSKIELRPGQYQVGWLSYSRKGYCEKVMKGYLIDC
jgi:hypothetical protein